MPRKTIIEKSDRQLKLPKFFLVKDDSPFATMDPRAIKFLVLRGYLSELRTLVKQLFQIEPMDDDELDEENIVGTIASAYGIPDKDILKTQEFVQAEFKKAMKK